MEHPTGIYSNRCWIEGRLQHAVVHINDGKIERIESGRPSDFNNIHDAGGHILMPGVIDIHVHINEPGRTDWEGFDTATCAAAAGGITTIIDMPLNSSPVTISKTAFDKKLDASKGKLNVNCGFYGGIVPGNYNDLEDLINAGVLGIKAFLTHSGIDEFPNVTQNDLEGAMPLFADHNIPLLVHCELSDDITRTAFSQHPGSYQHYLKSRPDEWEVNAVQLIIDLCRKHKAPVHIVHISSSKSLELIKKAKQEGLSLTAETCPHYIYFNAENIPDHNCLFKCAPPIRDQSNNNSIKSSLASGILDLIASDHSPAPAELKELTSGNLQRAWGGIAGLQFLLPASWSALKDRMKLEDFIPLVTEHPSAFLKMHHRKGYIKEGFDADLVLWSPEQSFIVKENAIFHKHKISPYSGHELFGKTEMTFVNGEMVFNDDQIIKTNAGKWLLRK